MVSKESLKIGLWYKKKARATEFPELVSHYKKLAKKFLSGKGGI